MSFQNGSHSWRVKSDVRTIINYLSLIGKYHSVPEYTYILYINPNVPNILGHSGTLCRRMVVVGKSRPSGESILSWLAISRRLILSWLGVTVTGNCLR